ncbi:MAG: hypothetical protein CO132_01930 [Candidatus Kerfeldbacteria bacterium CG_4_9_14_3_um_filter_45_8]|nr:MAG: hypothetical protein CO132_01930 [Candidatus Kerfeldbacteria bacterium CG_4_9_14_3_um_filter_45_8]
MEPGYRPGKKKRFGAREALVVGGIAAIGGALLTENKDVEPAVQTSDSGDNSQQDHNGSAHDSASRSKRDGRAAEPHEELSSEAQEHEDFRQQSMDDTLEHLADFDPNFMVTTTTSVNDVPVTDQFFGITYRLPSGNVADFATVFPDEATGDLSLDPSPELRQWVTEMTGQSLEVYSSNSSSDIASAASDLLVIQQLRDAKASGEDVTSEDVEKALVNNQYVSTTEIQEALEEERLSQPGDTGE